MNRIIFVMTIVSALLAGACVSINTPDGYAQREATGRYDFKAISTDASVVTVSVRRNEDKKQGTLDYWVQAAQKHMTLSRGHEFIEQGAFVTGKGQGKWMLFTKKYRGVDFQYLLGLVVKGRKIYVLEAGGEQRYFEADLKKMVSAFATLD